MNKTVQRSLIFLFVLIAFGNACKSKSVDKLKSTKEASVPLLGSDVWQGNQDQIDPKLGAIKTLD